MLASLAYFVPVMMLFKELLGLVLISGIRQDLITFQTQIGFIWRLQNSHFDGRGGQP